MDDNQSDSLWSHIRQKILGKDDDTSAVAKAVTEAQSEGDLCAEDAEMLHNVLRLSTLTVEDSMIPRADMACVELSSSMTEVAELFVEQGHSRMPVYRKDKDNVVGLVYVKDLVPALLKGGATQVRDVLRPVLYVPKDKIVRDMLRDFLARGTHMAIVLDAYGGTAGLVTLEDVLEEIVGEIRDEHDLIEPDEFRFLEGGTVLVAGRAYLEDVGEVLGVELASEHVDTLGGYLSEQAGKVPEEGEVLEVDGRSMEIREADKRQVHWVAVEPKPAEEAGAGTPEAAAANGGPDSE